MINKTLIMFLLFLSVSISADQKQDFIIEKPSQNFVYGSILKCQGNLTVGSFQNCSLKLTKANTLIKKAKVLLDGSMPAHNHGLPTSPKVIWSEDKNTHLIKGLKFSMPGKWSLNFKINGMNDELKDQIEMQIMVK